jgi:hypothetical protein
MEDFLVSAYVLSLQSQNFGKVVYKAKENRRQLAVSTALPTMLPTLGAAQASQPNDEPLKLFEQIKGVSKCKTKRREALYRQNDRKIFSPSTRRA